MWRQWELENNDTNCPSNSDNNDNQVQTQSCSNMENLSFSNSPIVISDESDIENNQSEMPFGEHIFDTVKGFSSIKRKNPGEEELSHCDTNFDEYLSLLSFQFGKNVILAWQY